MTFFVFFASTMEDWDVSFEQDIPFTTFVQKTLVNYALGIGVLQGTFRFHFSKYTEWIANADDAKATNFKILLDYNSYSKNELLCDTMQTWQGPAIWIYNSGVFSSNDWRGFSKI